MMTTSADAPPPLPDPGPRRIEVRSITGACYTLIEETAADGSHSYHTAYAQLPVDANADGTFTIVDTRTRLTRIDGAS